MAEDESSKRRHLRPNRGKNPNARWIVDEVPKKKPAPKKRKKSTKQDEPPILEGETRCSCNGTVSDDRPMAECEKCKTWQHVVCEFGVDDESALPDKYQCKQCRIDDDEAKADAADSASETSSSSAHLQQTNGGGSGAGLDQIKDKVRRSVAEAWLKIVEPLVAKYADSTNPKSYALQLALDIEAALFEKYADRSAKDPGHVYRDQFRMLSFNLKDDKNPGLQSDVVSRKTPPERFVTLSSAELRPPEMRKLAREIKKESLNETIIEEPQPPKEKISVATAELNMEPTFISLEQEEDKDSQEEDEAMKEPLGPPPTEASPQRAEEHQLPDEPVWEGRVRLGSKLDFAAAATPLQGAERSEWPQFLESGSALVIDGAVPTERATTYLSETASNEDAHTIASLVLSSADAGKLDELHEYLTSRDRVGAVEHSSPRVKDAYILPVPSAAPAFLGLGTKAKMYLDHVRTEHNADHLLLVVLVLFN